MHKLTHHRVVKLLGVIMEEGNYSLVMEFMEKGNLMGVLKAEVEDTWLLSVCSALGPSCLLGLP